MGDGRALPFTSVDVETDDSLLQRDLGRVVSDVADCFALQAIPPLGPKPLVVFQNGCPLCDVSELPFRYRIRVAPLDRVYDRFVYQLAHETGHVYCNPYVSNWLIETLCEMASQVCLHMLADKWKVSPPFGNWKSYAPKFDEYLSRHRTKMRQKCGVQPSADLDACWREMVGAFQHGLEDKNNRSRNAVVAEALIAEGVDLGVLPVVGRCCLGKTTSDGESVSAWLGGELDHPGLQKLHLLLEPLLAAWPAAPATSESTDQSS